MTPSECRPGTVVMWEVTGEVGVIDCFVDPFLVKLIGTGKAVFPALDPEHLQFAPRFFSENEWHTEMPTSFELQGSVQWRDGWKWWVAGTDSTLVSAPTYLAARQAVERACGIEKTE